MNEYINVFRNYANFSGFLKKKPYWRAVFIDVLIRLLLFLPGILCAVRVWPSLPGFYFAWVLPLAIFYCFLAWIPFWAAAVRRLHSLPKSSLTLLWGFVPVVGWILLLVILSQEGHYEKMERKLETLLPEYSQTMPKPRNGSWFYVMMMALIGLGWLTNAQIKNQGRIAEREFYALILENNPEELFVSAVDTSPDVYETAAVSAESIAQNVSAAAKEDSDIEKTPEASLSITEELTEENVEIPAAAAEVSSPEYLQEASSENTENLSMEMETPAAAEEESDIEKTPEASLSITEELTEENVEIPAAVAEASSPEYSQEDISENTENLSMEMETPAAAEEESDIENTPEASLSITEELTEENVEIPAAVAEVLALEDTQEAGPSKTEVVAEENAETPAVAAEASVPEVTEDAGLELPEEDVETLAAVAEVSTSEDNLEGDSESTEDPLLRSADGMEMVQIPEGSFIMGLNAGAPNARPEHEVTLSAYRMDKYEVSNAQYACCVASGACTEPHEVKSFRRNSYFGDPEYANFPVAAVDRQQAADYCAWAGGRLPTEAEWEHAARGPENTLYPWGNEFDGTKLNYSGAGTDYDTVAVDGMPQDISGYGVLNMAGNVMEWVADAYQENWYTLTTQTKNPVCPDQNYAYVIRGASAQTAEGYAQATFRFYGIGTSYALDRGFRCVMDGLQ